jgi:hypothetical protein
MLERVALNPEVSPDKLERLLAIQERVNAKRAEDDFNIAMSAAQSEMGPVSTDASNPQTHSRYATYGKLDRALRPIYTRHGFALSFGEEETPKAEHVRVVCYVTHRGGFTRVYHRDMPADGKGAKGGDVMTKTHASGAAQSYAMRYLLRGIFNVAVGEEDSDGNLQQRGPTITDAQVADLEALMDEVGIVGERKAKAMQVWQVAKLDEILVKNYAAVVKSVEAKRK